MIHFLRKERGSTIISCETGNNDLVSSVNIEDYSMMLIDLHNKDLHYPFIRAISELDEIRSWWWEQGNEMTVYESIDDFVKEKYIEVAARYNLYYGRD